MALDSAIYLVTRDIAMRSGSIDSRYRTADGRFILNNKDLSLVRLTSSEYINGLQGVERISEAEAQRLIAENHFQRGLGLGTTQAPANKTEETEAAVETPAEEVETPQDEVEEPQDENDNENNEQE